MHVVQSGSFLPQTLFCVFLGGVAIFSKIRISFIERGGNPVHCNDIVTVYVTPFLEKPMHPSKVDRNRLVRLTDLPNVGMAFAGNFRLLGITEPQQLKGRCPFELYRDLCMKTGKSQDPCVIDVFMSVASFIEGNDAEPWWNFTEERKRMLGAGRVPK